VCEHALLSFCQNPIQDFSWTSATLAKCVFHGLPYGKPPIVPSTTATTIGPLRQILQRKRMSAFRVIAEVAARCFKRRS
jgi:hypothetical protein